MNAIRRNVWLRTGEDTILTFLSAFLLQIGASGLDWEAFTNSSTWQRAGVAGLTAAMPFLRGVIVARLTNGQASGITSAVTLQKQTRGAHEFSTNAASLTVDELDVVPSSETDAAGAPDTTKGT